MEPLSDPGFYFGLVGALLLMVALFAVVSWLDSLFSDGLAEAWRSLTSGAGVVLLVGWALSASIGAWLGLAWISRLMQAAWQFLSEFIDRYA